MAVKMLALVLLLPVALCQNNASAPTNASKCAADQNNGFELTECGNDKMKLCCHPNKQVCLSGTPKDGEEQFMCSTNRALYGMKVLKVLLIPICCFVFLLGVFIIMCKQLKSMVQRPILGKLCLVQTLLAMLVVCSPLWKFPLYSAFVAVLVFFMMNVKGNKWVIIVLITLQLFNLLATMGAYGTSGVFVPLGLLSADNVQSWQPGVIDAVSPGSTCSGYYNNYFNLESVEINNEGADPEVKYYGYCTDAWITTVGAVVASKAVVQLFMLVLSMQLLQNELGGTEDKLKESA